MTTDLWQPNVMGDTHWSKKPSPPGYKDTLGIIGDIWIWNTQSTTISMVNFLDVMMVF